MKKITINSIVALTLLLLLTSSKTTTACNANFTHTNACAGDTVWFNAVDQNAIYTWDFGDNTSQTNINHDTTTFHVYNTPGTYTVMLFVNIGAEWDYQTQIITVGNNCFNADFTYTCGGNNLMYFNSTSIGATSQMWNFGDLASGVGNTSTLINPFHSFTSTGTYTVTLIATNGTVSDTTTQTVVITGACIGATFYSGNFANCVQDSTAFNVSYTGIITTYSWNFGDPSSGANNTSALSNPKHLFSATGFYIVTLIISNGADTETILYCLRVVECNCYPGDCNGDGEVTCDDIFPIGMFYGDHGPQRMAATNNFTSQPGTDWSAFTDYMYLQAMENKKIADCNGDSTINSSDLAVVLANYGMSHTTHNNVSGMPEANSTNPTMYIQLPSGSATSGATITAPIYLGDAAHPCAYLYGYSFTVNYNPALVVPGSVSIDLSTNWLGNNTNELTLTHDNYVEGKIDAAVVRYDKTQIASGFGQIGTITFQLQWGATGNFHLSFSPSAKALSTTMFGSTVSSNMEIFRPFNLSTADLSVSVGINNYTNDNSVSVFPNPATEELRITNTELGIKELAVYNLIGKCVYKSEMTTTETKINVSEFAEGLYTLTCTTKNGVVVKKINIVK